MNGVIFILRWFSQIWNCLPVPVVYFLGSCLGLTLFLLILRKARG